MKRSVLLLMLCGFGSVRAQLDTVKFSWPVPPFDESHYLNATFAEFRNTLTANHFHNGVDIGRSDGETVYPVLNGIVHAISPQSESGTDAYVRVRTQTPGGWKHLSYVHIDPNPSLTVGMNVIAGVTVLGTVIAGQGHVHLTERALVANETGTGVEINGVRSGGGLTPFTDLWSPVIDKGSLQFRRFGTRSSIGPQVLNGKMDVVIHIDERNSPEALGGTRTNNGTYAAGFRLLTPDTALTVYEPPSSGVRYRFDRKPSDTYVGTVFDEDLSDLSRHVYYLSNGTGADDINANGVVLQQGWDVSGLPEADFLLQIFSYDTRGNRDDAYFPVHVTKRDLTPPAFPVLQYAVPDGDGIAVAWNAPADADLKGFRLYYQATSGWTLAVGESVLTKTTTSIRLEVPLDIAPPADGLPRISVRISAVDTATPPNESSPSDTYIATPAWTSDAAANDSLLIVDGFDRWGGSGSWGSATHAFAPAVSTAYGARTSVGTVANESIATGAVALWRGRIVHWILGDESTTDRTFTSSEQTKVRTYLESGGALFVSGSEVGWDLGRTHSATEAGDLSFYSNYLKASFVYDGTSTMTSATGIAGTPFQGYTWLFGQTFPEDYPDDIDPVNGAVPLLQYNAMRDANTYRKAGIGYVGTFGASSTTGRLVYLAFPYESMTSAFTRSVLTAKALEFMGLTTEVPASSSSVPSTEELAQNFPNPFNPSTHIRYSLPARGVVDVRVFDLLGRTVAVLYTGELSAGTHDVEWNARGQASGVYIVRLQTARNTLVRSMVLLK